MQNKADGGQCRQEAECQKPEMPVIVQPMTGALGMQAWIQTFEEREANATSAGLV